MKKSLAYLAVLFFSFTGFSQTSKDVAEMKKKGIKKILIYYKNSGQSDTDVNMDTIPYTTVYFDHSGRIIKLVSLYPVFLDTLLSWRITTTQYDTLERVILNTIDYSRQPDPDQTKIFLKGSTSTYTYQGDSFSMEIDSNRLNGRLVSIEELKQTWHWKKTPPPHPKPILWPDSICTSKAISENWTLYYYKNSEAIIPYDSDSNSFIEKSFWSIDNGKATGKIISEFHRDNSIFIYETNKSYTLNRQYDTIVSSERGKFYRNYHDTIYCDSNSNHETMTSTFQTRRSGPFYFIRIKHERISSVGNQPIRRWNEHMLSKDPWTANGIMPDYNEENILNYYWLLADARYEMKHHKTKIIYW